MEGRRRGGGGGAGVCAGAGAMSLKCAFSLLLLVLALCGRGATGLDADGELLMAFRRAVTADPLGALRGWSYSDDSACAWNGVICNGFPQPQQASTVNLTSVSAADGSGSGNGNFSTLAGGRANGTLLGLNASMAAATVSRVIGLVLPGAQLSGSLPAELARVEHLRHLDLSGNGLNGTLPAALLLNATELRVLSLAGNDLSGALPDASYARGLQELNLSDNALAGWLPASLLRAPGLAVLGLANNYLAGELPAGGLGGLEVVDLSNNYFRGALPADFGGTQLRFLNVSSNSLTGALPADLSDVVPANTSVDLSNNNFTGAVPPAGPFAAQPASAYEGNPGLCGPPLKHACSIPSSLSNPPNATDSPPAFAAIPKSAAASAPPPYQAPECLKSLRPNAKWDVYSFGMVLLELLSGRVYSEVELCQWHAGAVDVQRGRVLRMADPTLRGEAADAGGEDALLGCFRLAFACCAMAPGKRPAMRDAAALLDRIQPTPSSASSAIETPPY
ncbi:unnamed protein product [Triticum turgidum subsp. durum]|uniref:Leucine-rich repeat-containing N-terminal plant-type domain-containing protein n=1 Tax=Triticum turgidum subsp. durum TaxID=4567 RepID=A0A9R1C5U4_TRITD|nr:unnamed protein product [Triticum turgidum subsp. durum]